MTVFSPGWAQLATRVQPRAGGAECPHF